MENIKNWNEVVQSALLISKKSDEMNQAVRQRACQKMAETLNAMEFCPAGNVKEREVGCRIGEMDCDVCILKYYLAIAEVEERAARRICGEGRMS